MIKLGLTGSIGMGKSTTLKMFGEEHIPIFSADLIVKELYEDNNEGVQIIKELAPNCVKKSNVDKKCLLDKIKNSSTLLKIIEQKIHPLVAKKQQAFINKNRQQGAWLIVLEIPLLFESKLEKNFDNILVVTCNQQKQKERVLRRENMDAEKFAFINSKQMPNEEKLAKADFIIDTSFTKEDTYEEIKKLICHLEILNDNE